MNSPVIIPTVGRRVWFEPNNDLDRKGFCQFRHSASSEVQPFDATIVFVWGITLVNLQVLDHAGNQFSFQNVPLINGENPPERGIYARWKPHQWINETWAASTRIIWPEDQEPVYQTEPEPPRKTADSTDRLPLWSKGRNPVLNKAAVDEPLFVLRGQDTLSPEIVRAWANTFKEIHCRGGGAWSSVVAEEKYFEAKSIADMMEKYHTRKLPS